jgi:hypothetical protein
LAIDPTDAIALAWLAHVRAGSGARAEACELMVRAVALHNRGYVPAFHLALGYVGLDDHDRAFEALKQAWLDRDPALTTIVVEPRFAPLRDDPRYLELIERLKMPISPDSRFPRADDGTRDSNAKA